MIGLIDFEGVVEGRAYLYAGEVFYKAPFRVSTFS